MSNPMRELISDLVPLVAAVGIAMTLLVGFVALTKPSSDEAAQAAVVQEPSYEDSQMVKQLSKLKLICLHGTQYWFSEGSYNQTTLTPRYLTSRNTPEFWTADCSVERHMMEVNP